MTGIMSNENPSDRRPAPQQRRSFMKTILAAGAAPFVLSPLASAQSEPKKTLRIGMVGCGGRGTWITPRFLRHGGYKVVAAADYFQDRVEAYAAEFDVPKSKCYTGLSCYEKLIEDGGVDAVVIKSPPYFHPEQAEACVKADKHVYLAKPIAVDVPGCLSVQESADIATRKGLSFFVDFQTRTNELFIEAIRRVHDGALGKWCFGEGIYHAEDPFGFAAEVLGPDPHDPERRLRAWGVDRVLSGDIITEQNIHTLDVMSWIMNEPPVRAMGHCNQKVRPWGNCNDHFSAIFNYSNDVDVSFTSRQFAAHGTKPEGIKNRMFGEAGVLETEYSGPVLLRGGAENFYRGGDTAGLYDSGAVVNVALFYNMVMGGDASNETVPHSVRSNLVTILGREAAYTGRPVTWRELMNSSERWEHDLELRS